MSNAQVRVGVDELAESIELDRLMAAWRQAHFAAQAVAEVGKSWAAERDDDGHSSLLWVERDGFIGLEGMAAFGDRPLRARLAIASLHLSLEAPDGEIVDQCALAGQTVAASLDWIGAAAERALGARRQSARPAPDLPEHPLAHGAEFELDPVALRVLANLYALTSADLERQSGVDSAFETARCWPHHFDLASLAVVSRDASGAMQKTVGVGLTPPDSVESAGYWYVSPWSRDGATERGAYAPLERGRWVDRGGSSMAVLPVTEPNATGEIGAFIDAAVAASKSALGVSA